MYFLKLSLFPDLVLCMKSLYDFDSLIFNLL